MTTFILIVLGLCAGSFINALVWRLREQEKTKKLNPRLSILSGRSMCPNCQHALGFWDLIPVVSWLGLKGKCRYCHKPISWQYPLVELVTAGLFVASYLYWPMVFDTRGILFFGNWLIMLTGLVALAVYDLKWMLLPDRIIKPLIALATILILTDVFAFEGGLDAIRRAILGLAFCGGIFYLLYQLSGGRWIGGGDVKLGFLLGLIVGGPLEALLIIFIASFLGTILALPIMAMGKQNLKMHLPFGPFLIAATIVVYLFGADLISWYKYHVLLI